MSPRRSEIECDLGKRLGRPNRQPAPFHAFGELVADEPGEELLKHRVVELKLPPLPIEKVLVAIVDQIEIDKFLVAINLRYQGFRRLFASQAVQACNPRLVPANGSSNSWKIARRQLFIAKQRPQLVSVWSLVVLHLRRIAA